MDHGYDTDTHDTMGEQERQAAITAAIRDAAYVAWSTSREPDQESTHALFDRVYLGHYASVAACAEDMVDTYGLDARLDTAIAEPFRRHVDIDVTALSHALVLNGTLYALRAVPMGVWVFNGEIS